MAVGNPRKKPVQHESVADVGGENGLMITPSQSITMLLQCLGNCILRKKNVPRPNIVASPFEKAMKKVIVSNEWPEAISDGLNLLCPLCNHLPAFDYKVSDSLWETVVPDEYKRGVICLRCLDILASKPGLDVAEHLEFVQFTGIGKTIVLLPDTTYYYYTIYDAVSNGFECSQCGAKGLEPCTDSCAGS